MGFCFIDFVRKKVTNLSLTAIWNAWTLKYAWWICIASFLRFIPRNSFVGFFFLSKSKWISNLTQWCIIYLRPFLYSPRCCPLSWPPGDLTQIVQADKNVIQTKTITIVMLVLVNFEWLLIWCCILFLLRSYWSDPAIKDHFWGAPWVIQFLNSVIDFTDLPLESRQLLKSINKA